MQHKHFLNSVRTLFHIANGAFVGTYAIELSQLTDGAMHVHMMAVTVDDQEPQLLSQEIVTGRLASIDDALAVIKEGVKRAENQ